MVRHLVIEAEPTEPTVIEVQVNLFAQPTFRVNAVAVATAADPSSLPASRLRDRMNQRTPCLQQESFVLPFTITGLP